VAGAVEPSLDDDGILTTIGTIVHQDTYLYSLLSDPQFKVLFYRAMNDEGVALWPERFPAKRLIAIRESMRSRGLEHMFYQEYLNMPRNPETQAFRESDFRFYEGGIAMKEDGPYIRLNQADGSYVDKPVSIFVGVDLAISSRGDYTVILPLAVDSDENFYVCDYYRKRVEPNEIIDELFRMKARYQPTLFIIETTAYQQALVSFLRREMNNRKIFFGVREVKPRQAKDVRLMSMEPFFKANKVYMKRSQVEILDELIEFPKGRNDDVIDALHNAISNASKSMRSGMETSIEGDQFVPQSWRTL